VRFRAAADTAVFILNLSNSEVDSPGLTVRDAWRDATLLTMRVFVDATCSDLILRSAPPGARLEGSESRTRLNWDDPSAVARPPARCGKR